MSQSPSISVTTSTATPNTSEKQLRRLLFVCLHFPPVGGAGVQRSVKFVKYLRRFGWDATVLTVENPSVPVFDHSLQADLPEDLNIVRTKTWEPGYGLKKNLSAGQSDQKTGMLSRIKGGVRRGVRSAALTVLQPDPQVLWLPPAYRGVKQVLKETPHDAVMVTAPPHSAFLLGAKLKRKFDLPLILDYRDEWDLSNKYLENARRDRFSCWMQNRMQRKLLRRADAVIATTQASTAQLARRIEHAGGTAQSMCIYNGFDRDDFQEFASTSPRKSEKFRLLYTGTLWNLTTIEPLVRAIQSLSQRKPELAAKLELCCIGRKTPEQQAFLNELAGSPCDVILQDYCDHSEVLKQMADANGLCLLLSDVPGAERVAPAKLFEYLAMKRTILSIVPEGETSEIVTKFFPESTFVPSQVAEMADWLEHTLQAGTDPVSTSDWELKPYTREDQAHQLSELLNDLASDEKISSMTPATAEVTS